MLRCQQKYDEIQSRSTKFDENENFWTQNFGYEPMYTKFGYTGSAADSRQDKGWKVHIGVDDSNRENLKKAWDLLVPLLRIYKIALGKIVRPHFNLAHTDPTQCAKQFTVYCFKQGPIENNLEYWKKFFIEVNLTLRQNGIAPAPIPNDDNDFIMQGSEYISYRNEAAGEANEGRGPFGTIEIESAGKLDRAQFVKREPGSSSSSQGSSSRPGITRD